MVTVKTINLPHKLKSGSGTKNYKCDIKAIVVIARKLIARIVLPVSNNYGIRFALGGAIFTVPYVHDEKRTLLASEESRNLILNLLVRTTFMLASYKHTHKYFASPYASGGELFLPEGE
jgi:hypothetical protein